MKIHEIISESTLESDEFNYQKRKFRTGHLKWQIYFLLKYVPMNYLLSQWQNSLQN